MGALLTLAVYVVTAVAALALAHRFVTPLRPGTAVLIASLPLVFTGPAMLTNRVYAGIDILYDGAPFQSHRQDLGVAATRSPSLADVVYQHIPWRAAVRRAVEEKRLPLWNPNVLAGEPLLAVQQAGLLRPAVLIGLILPAPQAWTYDVTVRLFTALLCALLYFRDVGCRPTPALLGAVGWAFSDFFLFFLGFSITPPTAPFPLMLLGARRVARGASISGAVILTLALAASLAGGHPESALHLGVATAAYFAFELSASDSAGRWRRASTGLLSALAALALCAVVLLPMAEILPLTREHAFRKEWYAKQKRSVTVSESAFRLAPQIVPYAIGVDGVSSILPGHVMPSSYAGALILPFAIIGLWVERRDRWFFLGLGLACLAVCTKTVAADWIARLPLFDVAINEYLIVLVTFALCALAAFGAQALSQGLHREAFLVAAAATAVALAIVHEHLRPLMNELHVPPPYRHERLLLQLIPIVAAGALVALTSRRRATIGIGATTAILVAARFLEEGRVNPTLSAESFYPRLRILDAVPRAQPERLVALGQTFLPNVSAVYDVEDVRGYSAMTLRALQDTFALWCVPQSFWFNRVDDPTRPFLSFLNVRWVLGPVGAAAPPGWPVRAQADGMLLLENPRVLNRVFVPRQYRGAAEPAARLALLAGISDFGERGVVEGDTRGDWVANGRAEVTIERYETQTFVLRVSADTEVLVGSSIPNWPGWRIERDGGVAVDAVPFNHAFLGFRVPPGSHRVILRYSPNGVRYGFGISAATLAAVAVVLARQRGSATTID